MLGRPSGPWGELRSNSVSEPQANGVNGEYPPNPPRCVGVFAF